MLSYPSSISLSTRTLTHLAGSIRAHRLARRSRWRRLDPGRQALLVLATSVAAIHLLGVGCNFAKLLVRGAIALTA